MLNFLLRELLEAVARQPNKKRGFSTSKPITSPKTPGSPPSSNASPKSLFLSPIDDKSDHSVTMEIPETDPELEFALLEIKVYVTPKKVLLKIIINYRENYKKDR